MENTAHFATTKAVSPPSIPAAVPSKLSVGAGIVKAKYEGASENIKKDTTSFLIPICFSVALFGGGVFAYKLCRDKRKSSLKIKEGNVKSENSIKEGHNASRDKMNEQDNQTDNRIREAQAFSEIRIQEKLQMQQFTNIPSTPDSLKQGMSFKEWIDSFQSRFTMPDYSAIPFLATILDGCPEYYTEPVMMSLLTECGALCFSKVRAAYNDGIHSPSLLTIIEGEHGSGKGKFLTLHNCLFERIIKSDAKKLTLEDGSKSIIQTAGINISQAKFYDVMAYNQGVHCLAIESEITTVQDKFKKSNGLSFDYLRKAFHNECVYQNNKDKNATRGTFPVYFNCMFTGTPKSVSDLIDAKEVEGGTA